MRYFLFIFVLLQFTSCSTLNSPYKYSTLEESKVFKFLTISGQPNRKTIDDIKDQDFDIVLNLRNPGEFTEFDEEAYVTSKSLEYTNLPFFNENKRISKENIQAITSFVEANKDKKIFIHCSSGNRTSAWLLIHLNKDHQMPLNKAITIASKTGLKEDLRKNVLRFIEKSK